MNLHDLINQKKVTKDDIVQTEEYKHEYDRQYASEIVLEMACRLVLRGSFRTLQEAVRPAELQLTVWGALKRLADEKCTMKWVPSGFADGNDNDFVKFITDQVSYFRFDDSATVNCWEMIILAAMVSDQIFNPKRLGEIYKTGDMLQHPRPLGAKEHENIMLNFEKNLLHELINSKQLLYEPSMSRGRPLSGDLVLFSGLDHVAMATGERILGPSLDERVHPTGTRIVSFWPAPKEMKFGAKTLTKVAYTTIEAILEWVRQSQMTTAYVGFANPNWALLAGS